MAENRNRLGFVAFCPETLESPFIAGLAMDGQLRGMNGDANIWLVPKSIKADIVSEEILLDGPVGLYISALSDDDEQEFFLKADVVNERGEILAVAAIVSLDKIVLGSYELAGRGYRNGLREALEAVNNGELLRNDGDAETKLMEIMAEHFNAILASQFSYVDADQSFFDELCPMIRAAASRFIVAQNKALQNSMKNPESAFPSPGPQ